MGPERHRSSRIGMLRDEYMRRYGNSSSLDEDDPESPTNAGSIAESPASPTYDAPPYLQLSPNDFVIASDELLAEDIHVLPPSSIDAEGRVKITRRGRQVSFSPAEPITTVDLGVSEEAEPRIPSKVPEAMKPINVTGPQALTLPSTSSYSGCLICLASNMRRGLSLND